MTGYLHWITPLSGDQAPVTFGIPWAKGKLNKNDPLCLKNDLGQSIPVQSKITAYWPDGSVKWSAHSAVLDTQRRYKVSIGEPQKVRFGINAEEKDDSVFIVSGDRQIVISQNGDMISGLGGFSGNFLAVVEKTDGDDITDFRCNAKVDEIILEESGPLRAVVRIKGAHLLLEDGECIRILPFDIRLYAYAGSNRLRIVHNFIFTLGQENYRLKGIGLELIKEMKEESDKPVLVAADQHNIMIETPSNVLVAQNTCDACLIRSSGYATFDSRSRGAVEAEGVGFAIRDFWQKAPMALEYTRMRGENAHHRVFMWMLSPYMPALDMSAFDDHNHIYAYGGINNEPNGIANTNELFIEPDCMDFADFAEDCQLDALLVCDPEVYADTGVFGSFWTRPDDPKYEDRASERALLETQRFFINEIQNRRWYGFWDYGDVMHTYDDVRHLWRYDVGGYAWQNTELCNTYAAWLTFLRTGEYDIYRFARALTRHCSEVDTYHAGKFAKLGSRHDIRHWGCDAKEVRISMAGHWRYFYYLTADERIGDIMDFVRDSDHTTLIKDPMDIYYEPHPPFSHCRTGPDWTSFLSNWMTDWERRGEGFYKEKLFRSIESIKKAPLGLSSGSTFHYEPETGMMHYMGSDNPAGHTHLGDGNYQQHMVIMFGGTQIWYELAELLEDDEFTEMVAKFGAFYGMTPDERHIASNGLFNEENDKAWGGRCGSMPAFASVRYSEKKYLEKSADAVVMNPDENNIVYNEKDGTLLYHIVPAKDSANVVKEVVGLTTNTASQWCLGYMELARLKEKFDELKIQQK